VSACFCQPNYFPANNTQKAIFPVDFACIHMSKGKNRQFFLFGQSGKQSKLVFGVFFGFSHTSKNKNWH
jgi:hypothetical protein